MKVHVITGRTGLEYHRYTTGLVVKRSKTQALCVANDTLGFLGHVIGTEMVRSVPTALRAISSAKRKQFRS